MGDMLLQTVMKASSRFKAGARQPSSMGARRPSNAGASRSGSIRKRETPESGQSAKLPETLQEINEERKERKAQKEAEENEEVSEIVGRDITSGIIAINVQLWPVFGSYLCGNHSKVQ